MSEKFPERLKKVHKEGLEHGAAEESAEIEQANVLTPAEKREQLRKAVSGWIVNIRGPEDNKLGE